MAEEAMTPINDLHIDERLTEASWAQLLGVVGTLRDVLNQHAGERVTDLLVSDALNRSHT
jgi:hypothetical protein